MENIQFINDTQGNQMVVLPLTDFQKMRPITDEELEDMVDCFIMQQVKALDEETIPHTIVERIVLNDESPLRVFREWRGYTVKQLAEKVDISAAYLSNMENGKREGTVSTFHKLAKALDVDIQDILPRMDDETS